MSASEFRFLGPPTPEEEVKRVLTSLADGSYTPEELESTAIDLKEEAGRRHNSGIGPGSPHNERLALQLTEEAACMANTAGGGALVVGVDDRTGDIIGADTDPDWLRTRIYQLSRTARDALRVLPPHDPATSALAWLSERGRISSTEYSALAGVSSVTAAAHLKALAEVGHMQPSWESGRGRGFHYVLPDVPPKR